MGADAEARAAIAGGRVPAGDERLAATVRSLARLARIVEQAAQASGISLAQYRLLLFVAREPQRAGELATRAAVSRPTLTNLVNGLERDGLIRRVPLADDRRGVRLEVTDAGGVALAEAEQALSTRVGQVLEDVEDLDAVLDAFADLDAALDREVGRFLAKLEVPRAER